MTYLEFLDWSDYIELLTAENLAFTRLDILDASTPGHYQFHLIASQIATKHGVLALCSALIYDSDEPGFMEANDPEKARRKFCDELSASLARSRKDVAAIFTAAKLRVRPGLYSIEPPPVLKLRK